MLTIGLAMNVFDAFPNAVDATTWELGKVIRSTVTGETLVAGQAITVIADVAETAVRSSSGTTPDTLTPDILLYVKPEDCPTLDTSALTNEYALHNTATGKDYNITSVGLGKNQETGELEHVELTLELTEFLDGQ